MKKYILIGLVLLISTGGFITVEKMKIAKEEAAIEQAIKNLFDGMRTSNGDMVREAFADGAILRSVSINQNGETVINSGTTVEAFAAAVDRPKEASQIWDERIPRYEIKVDGPLASVWTPYQFYIGENFSHCGVNSFQMAKSNGKWEIIYIVDTRRRTDCVE